MEYETRTIAYTVLPKGENLYSSMATDIKIIDEAAGEFVSIEQDSDGRDKAGLIYIMPEEWPFIRSAIDSLINNCRGAK